MVIPVMIKKGREKKLGKTKTFMQLAIKIFSIYIISFLKFFKKLIKRSS